MLHWGLLFPSTWNHMHPHSNLHGLLRARVLLADWSSGVSILVLNALAGWDEAQLCYYGNTLNSKSTDLNY